MAHLLLRTFAFLAVFFWATTSVLLITKALQEEAWAPKSAFSAFAVKLYGFCISIAYIARVDAVSLHRGLPTLIMPPSAS